MTGKIAQERTQRALVVYNATYREFYQTHLLHLGARSVNSDYILIYRIFRLD